jgi:hypothetical protein
VPSMFFAVPRGMSCTWTLTLREILYLSPGLMNNGLGCSRCLSSGVVAAAEVAEGLGRWCVIGCSAFVNVSGLFSPRPVGCCGFLLTFGFRTTS